ncbi:MAG TPA: DUF2793 domain-containing protein [Leptospiraceae bacterium]|nr:DUF2793 domain-containing protein [Leptospiraceae bacterium]
MAFFNPPNKTFVKSFTTTSPPVSPNTTDIYIVPSGASGAWSGQTDKFARYNGSSWDFILPWLNTLVWTEDSVTLYQYTGSAWVIPNATSAGSGANTSLSNLSSVSINSSLLFQSAKDIGSATVPPRNIYLYGSGTFGSHSFQLTGTPSGNRTLTLPDASTNLVGHDTSQTLTNKTINASNNTLSNITESMLSFSDVTTLNASTSQHGFLRKLSGNAGDYLDGSGNWSTPAGTGTSLPAADTQTLVKGSVDATKLLRFEIDGFTTGTTRILTPPDSDGTLVLESFAQTLTNKTINASNNTLSNITEAMLSFSDVTTLNVNTSRHGFAPKAPNDATKYLDGTGNYSTPAGTGPTLPFADNQDLFKNNTDNTKLVRFSLASISTGTTRTFTFPNVDDTLVTLSATQILSNKTLVTPAIGSFANAGHDHSNSAGGGNLTPTAFGLTDPNADRILFWDDSAGILTWLTLGTNLTITGTTLDATSGGGSGTPGGSGSELQYRTGSSTFGGVNGSSVTSNGYITLAPSLVTTGSPSLLTLTAPAHTTITASEFNDINWNLNRTVQFTGSTGFATQRIVRYQMPTLAFQNATGTITDAIGIEIDSPKQGTNATLTRSTAVRIKPSSTTHHGLWIDSAVSAAGDGFALGVAGTKVMRFTHVAGNTNFVFGEGVSISNSSTDGFIYAPVFSGSTSPSGTPTTYNNTIPFYFQNNNIEGFKRLWAYIGSAWINLTPFNMGGTNDPSVSGGTGAGTSPTISVTGKNGFHEVTLTTGTTPSASATVFTVTFGTTSGSFAVTPYMVLQASNSNAAALSGNGQIYVSARSTTSYSVSVGSTQLAASTQYRWIVHCYS